ncbi:MAG: M48 family metallopeptidase [Oscillospiraceae bacterium]
MRNILINEKAVLDDGTSVDYVLDIGDRKRCYISVREGIVTVKLPWGEPKETAVKLLNQHRDWLKKHMQSHENKKIYGFFRYEDGETAPLLGKNYSLKLVESNRYFKPYFSDNSIMIAVHKDITKEQIKMQVDSLLSDFACEQINLAFKEICPKLELYPKKVTVKNMKSRWGSCSSKGNISINYNIIFHDRDCLEYVVIHELCHLKYMNHSKDFWDLVAKYCPDWKDIRKKLNK